MTRKLVSIGVFAAAAWLLAGCSSDGSPGNGTFGCPTTSSAMSCVSGAQYCRQTSSGSAGQCVALPSGCSANPCSDCLAMGSGGILTCSSPLVGSVRETTVTVNSL